MKYIQFFTVTMLCTQHLMYCAGKETKETVETQQMWEILRSSRSDKSTARADELKRILATGRADIQSRCTQRHTTSENNLPLEHAIFTGNLAHVNILLDHKADPTRRDAYGNTILHSLATISDKGASASRRVRTALSVPPQSTAFQASLDALLCHHDIPSIINAGNWCGVTPLMLASERDNTWLLPKLRRGGAHPCVYAKSHAKTGKLSSFDLGATRNMWEALYEQNLEKLQKILATGQADTNFPDGPSSLEDVEEPSLERTPLIFSAVRCENPAFFAELLKHKADPTKCGLWGTPVHVALAMHRGLLQSPPMHHVLTANRDMVRILNVVDNTGRTPIMCALERGDADTAGHLLAHGADPSIPDKDGRDAFYYARSQAHILRLLHAHRARKALTPPPAPAMKAPSALRMATALAADVHAAAGPGGAAGRRSIAPGATR